MQRITLELATWHSPPITEPHMAACAEPMLFVRSREWLGLVPQRHSNAEVHAKLTGSTLSTDALAVELLQLESLVAHVASPIVFCHNDALAFNMIVQPDGDMMLCDVEYGAYNYRGFDIGNHWCEWTGFELDATRFPDKAQQLQWCKYYLDALRRVDPTTPNANTSPEQLRREGQACTLASELFWTAWALVQAEVSEIDFDYAQYAIDRWLRYLARKDEVYRECGLHAQLNDNTDNK
jgi:ethanolamine kinase